MYRWPSVVLLLLTSRTFSHMPHHHLLYIAIHNVALTARATEVRVAAGAGCHVTGMGDGGVRERRGGTSS